MIRELADGIWSCEQDDGPRIVRQVAIAGDDAVLLVDTGLPGVPAEELLPLVARLGRRELVVLITHPDSDHLGGTAELLAQRPDARVLAGGPDLPLVGDPERMIRERYARFAERDDVPFGQAAAERARSRAGRPFEGAEAAEDTRGRARRPHGRDRPHARSQPRARRGVDPGRRVPGRRRCGDGHRDPEARRHVADPADVRAARRLRRDDRAHPLAAREHPRERARADPGRRGDRGVPRRQQRGERAAGRARRRGARTRRPRRCSSCAGGSTRRTGASRRSAWPISHSPSTATSKTCSRQSSPCSPPTTRAASGACHEGHPDPPDHRRDPAEARLPLELAAERPRHHGAPVRPRRDRHRRGRDRHRRVPGRCGPARPTSRAPSSPASSTSSSAPIRSRTTSSGAGSTPRRAWRTSARRASRGRSRASTRRSGTSSAASPASHCTGSGAAPGATARRSTPTSSPAIPRRWPRTRSRGSSAASARCISRSASRRTSTRRASAPCAPRSGTAPASASTRTPPGRPRSRCGCCSASPATASNTPSSRCRRAIRPSSRACARAPPCRSWRTSRASRSRGRSP